MQGNDEIFPHEQVEGGRRGSGQVDEGASNGGDPVADLPHAVHLGALTQPSSYSKRATFSGMPSWNHTISLVPVPTLSPEPLSTVPSDLQIRYFQNSLHTVVLAWGGSPGC